MLMKSEDVFPARPPNILSHRSSWSHSISRNKLSGHRERKNRNLIRSDQYSAVQILFTCFQKIFYLLHLIFNAIFTYCNTVTVLLDCNLTSVNSENTTRFPCLLLFLCRQFHHLFLLKGLFCKVCFIQFEGLMTDHDLYMLYRL